MYQVDEEGASPRFKLGLALSGGGFRASFFHIGILAQLASRRLLRHVEVISSVSGGSIIAAYYYLHLKRLLEHKKDEEITDQDYADIIRKIEVQFFQAVERDFFYSTYKSFSANLRMSRPDYSRSDRIGELFDELLYRPLLEGEGRTEQGMVKMRELIVKPAGCEDDFNPEEHNAGRKAKVPVLLLNATLLNSGRNWRFQAVRMGDERDRLPERRDVDKNLRFMLAPSYADIPAERQRDFKLGHAVAASAAVPGIFTPLSVSDMYEDARIQLVDGGVHDNQGIQGLLEKECTHLIISDASGQMNNEKNPSTRVDQVLTRTQSIFEKRLREEQLYRVFDEFPGRVAYMHLRKGLDIEVVPLTHSRLKIDYDGTANHQPPLASSRQFGVDPKVQELLSNMRTHLDAFTQVEAYSLMLDGYLMGDPELEQLSRALPHGTIPDEPLEVQWEFRHPAVEQAMASPTEPYLRQLEAAESKLWKIFILSRKTSILTGLALGCLIIALCWMFAPWLQQPLFDMTLNAAALDETGLPVSAWFPSPEIVIALDGLHLLIAAAAAGALYWLDAFFLKRQARKALLRMWETPYRKLVYFLFAVLTLIVTVYLFIFNRMFLSYGQISRLQTNMSGTAARTPGTDADAGV